MVQKIQRRFEGVRAEVRADRNTLLAEAFSGLSEMRAERQVMNSITEDILTAQRSVDHFNTLIDLEAEYAKFGREITATYEDLFKSGNETCRELSKVIQDHDRHGLSKKFPSDLTPASLQSMQRFR